MTVLNSVDGQCKEITAPSGRTYRATRGQYHVESDRDAKAMRAVGCFPVQGAVRAAGRTCTGCGFVAFFTVCGRCGAPTRSPHAPAQQAA